MKRIFVFIVSLLLIAATSFAQHNVYYWGKDGNVYVEPVSKADSLTFSAGNWLFKVSTASATQITMSSFNTAVNVMYAKKVRSISKTPEIGLCFSSSTELPTYDVDDCKRLGTDVKEYDFSIFGLDPGTTYYYRAYVKLEDEVIYSDVKSVTTSRDEPSSTTYIMINGHRFVDLGLPSGLLWAEVNVGAATAYEMGDYYAWGETEVKSSYTRDNYKWGSPCTKYNQSDGKTILDSADDVATVKWGKKCRIPSTSEFEELHKKCEWTWMTDYNGITCYLVKGPNGNSIIFPAAGWRGESHYNLYETGGYWANSVGAISPYESIYSGAYLLDFRSYDVSSCVTRYRHIGVPVRAVAKK